MPKIGSLGAEQGCKWVRKKITEKNLGECTPLFMGEKSMGNSHPILICKTLNFYAG